MWGRRGWTRCAASLGAMAAGLALGAGAATAKSFCGIDATGPTACPVPTSETVTGAFEQPYENDFFKFFARKGTQITLTAEDREDPECYDLSSSFAPCGDVQARLYNGRGQLLGESDDASVNNYVPYTSSVSRTLRHSGIYFAVAENDVPFPHVYAYGLAINASPNIAWPPLCVVPTLRRDNLGTARRRLRNSSCRAGRVRRVHSRVHRGKVTGTRPGAGRVLARRAKVEILVSAG